MTGDCRLFTYLASHLERLPRAARIFFTTNASTLALGARWSTSRNDGKSDGFSSASRSSVRSSASTISAVTSSYPARRGCSPSDSMVSSQRSTPASLSNRFSPATSSGSAAPPPARRRARHRRGVRVSPRAVQVPVGGRVVMVRVFVARALPAPRAHGGGGHDKHARGWVQPREVRQDGPQVLGVLRKRAPLHVRHGPPPPPPPVAPGADGDQHRRRWVVQREDVLQEATALGHNQQ